jgi:hypothetical protein
MVDAQDEIKETGVSVLSILVKELHELSNYHATRIAQRSHRQSSLSQHQR